MPAITVATAAPAFAASQPAEYQTVTRDFIFDAGLDLGGTIVVIGQVDVQVVATIPLVAPRGETLDPTTTVSTVTIPANLVGTLKSTYLPGATQIDGTSTSTATLSGAINGPSVSNLTIPRVPLPAAGEPLITVASGGGSPLVIPAGATPGSVTISLEPPNSTLLGYDADGNRTSGGTNTDGSYRSVLYARPGETYVIGTFDVV